MLKVLQHFIQQVDLRREDAYDLLFNAFKSIFPMPFIVVPIKAASAVSKK